MARIVTIIGTRPEVIKMAPVVAALDGIGHDHVLVHSGQHYDLMMDEVFFRELGVREPDHRFELRELPPHRQVTQTVEQIADVAADADLVVIHGDTNTTLAGALLANKLGRRLAHVEAGIRSFDRSMPEEINRIVADQLSHLRFAPTEVSQANLARENVREGVHVVGNSVIDALVQNVPTAETKSDILRKLDLTPGRYAVLTFHRVENVDRRETLQSAIDAFIAVAKATRLEIVFPVHPRTLRKATEYGLVDRLRSIEGLRLVEPTGYFDMLRLEKDAALMLTDSGGLQEEACFLRVPCVTLRENTERPETLEIGANVLAGTSPERVVAACRRQLGRKREWSNPYGDGTTGKRIAAIVSDTLR